MNPSNENNSRKIERNLHEADQTLSQLFAQTPEEVKEMEAMFGSTPGELPASLQDPRAVLDRIKQSEQKMRSPSAFGKLLKLLRTKKRLTSEQLADKTDLDAVELDEIESSPENIASPMVVSELTKFFKLKLQNTQKLAGLVSANRDQDLSDSLCIAACSKTEFGTLTREERKAFRAIIKQLKR